MVMLILVMQLLILSLRQVDFDSNLFLQLVDTQDLGDIGLEWRDLFLDGTAHNDTLDVDESAPL